MIARTEHAAFILIVALMMMTACGIATPATLKPSGYDKVPIRVAVVLTQTDDDWGGAYRHKRALFDRVPIQYRCQDDHGWSYHNHLFSDAKATAQETLRKNLGLLLREVEFLSNPPGPGAYDLILYPSVSRWPRTTDRPDEVIAGYRLRFVTPTGEVVVDRTAEVTLNLIVTRASPLAVTIYPEHAGIDYDPQRLVGCTSWVAAGFTTGLRRILGIAHAAALKRFFEPGPEGGRGDLLAYVERIKEEARRRELPSALTMEAEFDDSEGILPNGVLDAGEEAQFLVRVVNRGNGTAYAVRLSVVSDTASIHVAEPVLLGDIPPDESRALRVSVRASLDALEGAANISVDAMEQRGDRTRRMIFRVPTARLTPPRLEVTSYHVAVVTPGAASEGSVGSGDTVDVEATLENKGLGPAVRVHASGDALVQGLDISPRSLTVGTIAGGASVPVRFTVRVPRTFAAARAAMMVTATDGRGAAIAVTRRELPFSVSLKAPALTWQARLLVGGAAAHSVATGDRAEVEITVENSGNLRAEDVVMEMTRGAGATAVTVTRSLGTIPAGGHARPERFEVAIARDSTDSTLPVKVELRQRDFSTISDRVDWPVRLVRPDLRFDAKLRGALVEQGGLTTVDVAVENLGNLAAEDVRARLVMRTPGVYAIAPEEVALGRIAPGDTAHAQFGLRVSRDAPVGPATGGVEITQRDFGIRDRQLALTIAPESPEIRDIRRPVPLTASSPTPTALGPVIIVVSPEDGTEVPGNRTDLKVTIADLKGIANVQVSLNSLNLRNTELRRTIRPPDRAGSTQRVVWDITAPISLQPRRNSVAVSAVNTDGMRESVEIAIVQKAREGNRPTLPAPYLDSWALVVGINAYHRASRLNYAVADALAVAAALPGLGFPARNIRVLTDHDATKEQIEQVLYRSFAAMGADDRLFVFFAGHGATAEVKGGEEGYLLPVNAEPSALPLTAISMEDVRRIGQRVRAKHVLFVIDTCFSGFALTRDVATTETPSAFMRVFREPVVQVLTAGRRGETALEDAGHGIFTRRLLDALRGQADSGQRGFITASELGAWLEANVPRETRGQMTPQHGRLFGEGQFIFLTPQR